MAGLNNFLSDSQQTQTTMPGWYDAAQQGIVSQGNTAMANAPTMAQTTAQGAVNTLQGAQNPFNQAQSTLQQISSGAANPWITDASGQVTPDTSTAMGGLFQAQKQQLNQLLPSQYEAPVQAGAIGSGQFGSLRGQTAVDKARADAFMNLNAQQLQAALTNQQTGATAAAQMGNVGQQGINAAMNVGIAQQNAPFRNLSNYSNLVGGLQAPTTVTSQKQLSGLGQINAIGNLTTGLLTGAGLTIPGLIKTLFPTSNPITGGGGTNPGGNAPVNVASGITLPNGIKLSFGSPVTGNGVNGGPGTGQVMGDDGKVYDDPTYGHPEYNSGISDAGSVVNQPPPEGAVNELGESNPGWYQDQQGNWTQLEDLSGNNTTVPGGLDNIPYIPEDTTGYVPDNTVIDSNDYQTYYPDDYQ
jgi:hypothetical protein